MEKPTAEELLNLKSKLPRGFNRKIQEEYLLEHKKTISVSQIWRGLTVANFSERVYLCTIKVVAKHLQDLEEAEDLMKKIG